MLMPSSYVSDRRETCSDQIYHALPIYCYQENHQGGSDFVLDRFSDTGYFQVYGSAKNSEPRCTRLPSFRRKLLYNICSICICCFVSSNTTPSKVDQRLADAARGSTKIP